MGELVKSLILIAAFLASVGALWLVLYRLGLLKPAGTKDAHPYRVKDRLLTPGEAAFFSALRAALVRTGGGTGRPMAGLSSMPTVLAMVRMCDVVEVDRRRAGRQSTSARSAARSAGGAGSGGGWQAAQNKIDRKHFDFVLIDAETTRPLLAIELDDRTHDRPDRRRRDGFVEAACDAAGLPLLRVRARPPGASYDVATLSAEIERLLEGAQRPGAAAALG